jgi:hypothetical protein
VLKWLIRFGAGVAVTAAVAWIAREALKLWVDGPNLEPSRDPWPQVARGLAPTAPTRPADGPEAAVAAPLDPPGQVAPPGATWVLPDGNGAVPDRHPVKAKLRSRLYHLPGMVAYQRTQPDRCYPTAEAAEADGFKRAKR